MPSSKNNYIYFFNSFGSDKFCYGFGIKEDSGGGFRDFNNTWNNQTTFIENSLIDSIRNTKTAEIRENINSHFPFSYILNKFFESIFEGQRKFLKSIFILNFLCHWYFFFSLKDHYLKKNLYLLGCLSSILYLSPYFRTSSYWAGMENYGLFMFVISFYFFLIIYKEKNKV